MLRKHRDGIWRDSDGVLWDHDEAPYGFSFLDFLPGGVFEGLTLVEVLDNGTPIEVDLNVRKDYQKEVA